MTTALVVLEESDLGVLTWAARVASALGGPLRVVCVEAEGGYRLTRVSGDGAEGVAGRALGMLVDAGAGDGEVYVCGGSNGRRSVLKALGELGVHRVVLHAAIGGQRMSRDSLVRRIGRSAPYDVVVLDPGGLEGEMPVRVVVPQVGGGGEYALRVALRVFGGGEGVDGVAAVADPLRRGRSGRVVARVREAVKSGTLVAVDSEGSASLESGLGGLVASGDLVLLEAEHARATSRLLSLLRELRREHPEVPFGVGLARTATAAGPGEFERLRERLRLYVPGLSRDERKDLHARLESGGRVSTDFVVMLMLSAGIAALGLVQSSAAVVIGAMLVAPLMTPLMASGLAIVQGNARMFREARRAMVVGILGAFLVSLLVGLASPWEDLSSEVLARGAPNVFDMAIALLSGVAGAYAIARPGLAGTLVGVAIAVALVPPLAAVGIAVAHWNPGVVLGALLLFVTNLLAITLGAALVFRLFGVQVTQGEREIPGWVFGVIGVLVLGTAVMLVPLGRNLEAQIHQGVNRPYAQPLPPRLREAIRERVAGEPGVEILLMAQSDVDHGFGVEVVLVGAGAAVGSLRGEILEMVRAEMGDGVEARVLVVSGAEGGGSGE